MQSASMYPDLLWDFSYEGFSSRGNEVTLRVFRSEQEMFESRGRSASGVPVLLPMEWLGSDQGSRSERSRSRSSASLQEYQDIGRRLWEAIPYWSKSTLLEATPDHPCRLKISSDSDLIDDLPWEWLNDKPTRLPIALRPGTSLVRSIPIRMAIPPISVKPPLHVLLVLTNPKDERLLDPWREIEAIRPRLGAPPYMLRVLEEPTWEGLVRVLREEPPHIVHYIGHAGVAQGEGNIILHDWNNRTHWITGPELAQVLPLSVRLLCLSTCFTVPNYQILGLPRLAHTSVTYRLPTTLTNRYPVEEGGVKLFWSTFYDSLAVNRGNASEAFRSAQRKTRKSIPGTDWGSFSLVIRDQSGEALRLEEAGEKLEEDFATTIQAQLASHLANDLAERLSSFGPESADVVKRLYEDTAARASDLAARSSEGRES
jgi:hypothetical protein